MNVAALIADDEPVARAGLRHMLGAFSWVSCVGEAASGPAAVAAIDALRPELVFLDIQMPGLLGTDVLRQVRHQPFVVFTTAYAQHAVTAFELGALDYLLKPFGPERLATTLERVRAAVGEPASLPAFERLHQMLASGPMTRLFVRSGGSVIPVAVDGVAWFEALGDYVAAHVGRARHVLHVSLNRLEERLDPERFARIHRAHIVNLDQVVAFRRPGPGQLVAEMADGTRLPVSRNRARALRGLAV
ncbi:MAG TPA: LytTR family DNA-binding domain-containing protein [Thermoanaerobaculia bacterium]|nr:LytTR family DNA-binding domain-containing protein [Thermoanaerobaculia bacterium]